MAGRAPARRTLASSSASWVVKRPWMTPSSEIWDWMVGAESTRPSRTMARRRPTLRPGLALELLGALRVQGELDVGGVGLGVDAGAGVLEVATGDDRLPPHQVEDGLAGLVARALDHLHVVGHLALEALEERLLASGPMSSTSFKESWAVVLITRLACSTSVTPGSWTRIWSPRFSVGGDDGLGDARAG